MRRKRYCTNEVEPRQVYHSDNKRPHTTSPCASRTIDAHNLGVQILTDVLEGYYYLLGGMAGKCLTTCRQHRCCKTTTRERKDGTFTLI